MSISRRSFLGVLAGAIAAASAGLPVIASPPTETPKGSRRKVNARHIYAYDASFMHRLPFLHRIDVMVYDERLRKYDQWSVDLMSENQALTERDLAPALAVMNDKLAEFDCEIGEVKSYSMQEWMADQAAQKAWPKIGAGA